MVDNGMPAPQRGLLDKAKELASPDAIAEKLNISRNRLFDFGLYLGIGFLAGFLLKKYSRYVFALVAMVLGLVVLQHMGVIMVLVNWERMHELFGVQRIAMQEGADLMAPYMDWVKANIGLVISFSGGFLIGVKLG